MTATSLLAGLATEEKQDELATAIALLGTDAKLELIRLLLAGTLSVSGPLTSAQLSAAALMTNAKGEEVRALLAGTLAVSGPLTDAQLAARGLATQTTLEAVRVLLAGTIAVSGPLTNAQLTAAGLATAAAQTTAQTTLAALLTAMQAATPAGEFHVGEVGGNTVVATANFTRPADTNAYAVGDLVANSTTAGSVLPMSLIVARKNAGTGRVLRARLAKTSASLTNASFRVHLFKTAPATTPGDNAAFAAAVSGVAAVYLGYVDVTMDVAFTDGAKGFGALASGPCISFDAPAGVMTMAALIEARAAYTPGSAETFTLALEVDRD
jgi:hypothetical protein